MKGLRRILKLSTSLYIPRDDKKIHFMSVRFKKLSKYNLKINNTIKQFV